MPPKIYTPQLSSHWRDKIRAGMIINRLMRHVEGKLELKSSQIRAAEILLRKVIPDLAHIDHKGAGGSQVIVQLLSFDDGKPILANQQKNVNMTPALPHNPNGNGNGHG